MMGIGQDQVERGARALLKEAIERSGWYPILSGAERNKRIEQDVDATGLSWRQRRRSASSTALRRALVSPSSCTSQVI
jgi:hypothetical protein